MFTAKNAAIEAAKALGSIEKMEPHMIGSIGVLTIAQIVQVR